jgi:DNA-binding NarL/FixJ family response regulator
MPDLNGLEAAREIRKMAPIVPILLFTMHDNLDLHSLKASGVQGCVLKSEAGKTLFDAVDALVRGETFFPSLK